MPKPPRAARTRVELLLDQDHLTTGYPELTASGGKGATVSLRYGEALWKPGGREKGHRNDIEGNEFHGYRDIFRPDGGENRLWRPLFWRTWRYLELTVETGAEPLTIEDLRGVYTGYPFERKARFDAGSDELDRILDIGWRTARLCAHESYMDCPYYEQLQYAGDTRIQALVSVYMSGDARLMRNAIEQLGSSQTSEGATYSRAPSALQQYIPPFSLWWIGMVRDYWWYVDDAEFARQMLPQVRSVLAFFGSYQKMDASLGPMPWWNYVDWVERWQRGIPPMAEDGSTAAIELQLLLAYQWATELEDALGLPEMASVYRVKAEELKASIYPRYWDGRRGLLADSPARRDFSQQANSLAVLAGIVRGDGARGLVEATLADSSLAPASIYFRYYLHRALVEAGMGDQYLDMLGPWRKMMKDGLTTWAERDGFRVRSDCHAWGSSPNVELFRTVLGVDSAAPGFSKVRVRPHLGPLNRASGAIPHPKGEIAISLRKDGDSLNAEVTLPAEVEGTIEWHDARLPLKPGDNSIRLP
ncbi:MAG: alpha-rhamnosidase [bacterium]|nr:alpha-rhamnosidase [bacterium]